jgi:flagellar M-ring protein FliF
MDQLRRLIQSLTLKQRITIVAIAVGVAAAIWQFSLWQRERDFRPLYGSLAAEDAGAVVQKLRESNVEYRLSDNGTTVLVPASRVAEMRLDMASAGLPKSGRIGFELFDKTNFGMTEFAEHVNYRRALEGELERSVMSLAEVEQARVHLTFPKESVFLESRENAKASVLIRLRAGAKLAPQSVQSITNLVASAVEGLAPESISVLDVRGNLLNRPRRMLADSPEVSEAALEFQQAMEKDFSAKINSTLDPLLGQGKFRAAVSAECDFTSGEQSEETFDPTKSVMTSSMKTDDQQTNAVVAGTPGTTSNLPRPAAATTPTSGMTRRTEQVNYQTSRLTRHTKLPQGTVKRLSVAVLLDQAVRWDGAGPARRRVLVPPAPETVKSIHDLVAAAIGFSQQRGDLLTVESLPFEATLSLEPPEDLPQTAKPVAPASGLLEQLKKNPLMMSAVAAGAFLLLAIVAWVAFTKFLRKRQRVSAQSPAELPPGSVDLAQGDLGKAGALGIPAVPSGDMSMYPAIAASRVEVLAGQLRAGAPKDPELYASVLRGWLTEEAKN